MLTKDLLDATNCQLTASRQDVDSVFNRQQLSRMLLQYYPAYNALRLHLFHSERSPALDLRPDHHLLQILKSRQWIRLQSPGQWKLHRLSDAERVYLQGGWLEELLFLAHHAAGCDELYLGAQLQWQVGDVMGANEVDILARRGDILSFTSCKCIQPQTSSTHEQVRHFMLEAAYWNTHFAQDRGRAVLAVTADMFDENRDDAMRYPALYARAVVIDVDLLGLEHLGWESLVQVLRHHWLEGTQAYPVPVEF